MTEELPFNLLTLALLIMVKVISIAEGGIISSEPQSKAVFNFIQGELSIWRHRCYKVTLVHSLRFLWRKQLACVFSNWHLNLFRFILFKLVFSDTTHWFLSLPIVSGLCLIVFSCFCFWMLWGNGEVGLAGSPLVILLMLF